MKLSSEQNKLLLKILKESDKKRNEYYKNTIRNFIKNIPNIVYSLILLDNTLGPLALSQNELLREIIENKENNIIEKVQKIINVLLIIIDKNPKYLYNLLESYKIIESIKSNKLENVSFTDPETLIIIIVWILEISNRVNKRN